MRQEKHQRLEQIWTGQVHLYVPDDQELPCRLKEYRQAYSKRLNGSVGKCLTTVGAKLFGVVKIGSRDMEEACSPLGADRIHFTLYDRFVLDNEPPDFS